MLIGLDTSAQIGGKVFQYDITVRRGKEERCYRLGEEELTPERRELVKRLTERARKG